MYLYCYNISNNILEELWETWLQAFEQSEQGNRFHIYQDACKTVIERIEKRLGDIHISSVDYIYGHSARLSKFFWFPTIEKYPHINLSLIVIEEMCHALDNYQHTGAIERINTIFYTHGVMLRFIGGILIYTNPYMISDINVSSIVINFQNQQLQEITTLLVVCLQAYRNAQVQQCYQRCLDLLLQTTKTLYTNKNVDNINSSLTTQLKFLVDKQVISGGERSIINAAIRDLKEKSTTKVTDNKKSGYIDTATLNFTINHTIHLTNWMTSKLSNNDSSQQK